MRSHLALAALLSIAAACTPAAPTPSSTPLPPSPTASAAPSETPSPSPAPTITPAPTPTPDCLHDRGELRVSSYPSTILRKDVPLLVFLPPCYELGEQRFPTLYLFHGFPFDERHWDDLGADELAGTKIEEGIWPPFLIVMPQLPDPLFTESDGGPRSYEAEAVESLVPFVDDNYRTDAQAPKRAVAGISRGAIWALEISFRHPDLFGSVAALSPALSRNHARPDYDPFEIIRSGRPLPERIYLMAGYEDWALPQTRVLSQALHDRGLINKLVVIPGSHEDATWQMVLQDMLAYFLASWQQGEP